jgi:phage shock protein E
MTRMEWITILIVLGVVAGLLVLKSLGSISPEAAREYLQQGAKVIDVRSPEEFRGRHLPNAINIPLGELEQRISHHAPNQQEVLLLHCLSGGRSGLGRRVLKRMGYTKVFNLGSLRRAEKIIRGGER